MSVDLSRLEANCAVAQSVLNLASKEDDELLTCEFNESRQFTLYQDPDTGALFQRPGRARHVLTFEYGQGSLDIRNLDASGPVSLLAAKTAMLMQRLLHGAAHFQEEFTCAQPPSDYELPIVSASIDVEKMAKYDFRRLWDSLEPSFAACQFLRGCPAAEKDQDGVKGPVRCGDLVIVPRSNKAPTYALVLDNQDGQISVSLERGRSKAFPADQPDKILGHWPKNCESPLKRQKSYE